MLFLPQKGQAPPSILEHVRPHQKEHTFPCNALECSLRAMECCYRCMTDSYVVSNPRRFEKLVGSLYLGEIVRHALIALTAEKALFTGNDIAVLKEKGVFTMQHVLDIIK